MIIRFEILFRSRLNIWTSKRSPSAPELDVLEVGSRAFRRRMQNSSPRSSTSNVCRWTPFVSRTEKRQGNWTDVNVTSEGGWCEEIMRTPTPTTMKFSAESSVSCVVTSMSTRRVPVGRMLSSGTVIAVDVLVTSAAPWTVRSVTWLTCFLENRWRHRLYQLQDLWRIMFTWYSMTTHTWYFSLSTVRRKSHVIAP